MSDFIRNYHRDVIETFQNYKKLAEKALLQVSDEEFFEPPDSETNSIAVIIKHMSGNQRSRFTNFLTTDGEKPDRLRDTEFEITLETREELMNSWDAGWEIVFEAIGPLSVEDLCRTVEIRGEPHTVTEALNRQLTHYAYHIGQIAFLAKQFRAETWKSLSVPRNKSSEFNEFLKQKKAAGGAKSHPLSGPAEFGKSQD